MYNAEMKIILDPLKQLNYHPLKVYFMLSSKDYTQYADNLRKLNRYKGLTQGLFKFHAVLRGKSYFQELTDDLKHAISKNNIIVRLVNDSEGNFCYALGRINFSQDPDSWEENLRKFVVEVCKYNLDALSSLYESEGNFKGGHVALINRLKEAINQEQYKQGVWRKILTPKSLRVRNYCHIPDHIKILRDSVYKQLDTASAKEDFNKMMAYFEEIMDAPKFKDSDSYAEAAVNQTYAKNISDDYRSRVRKFDRPNITISIKKVVAKVGKYKVKQEWGVEIGVDGEVVPVYIGSTAAAMVYICTLLRHRIGDKLFRGYFRLPLAFKQKTGREGSYLLWIEQVYQKLYPGASVGFDDWYRKMQLDSCRFINQGKSESARVINRCLVSHPAAIYYCCLQKGQTEGRDTFYYFDLPAESIVVPSDFEDLLCQIDF